MTIRGMYNVTALAQSLCGSAIVVGFLTLAGAFLGD